MFEIGNSLREARLRQGLDFPEIEQATKIRPKYLRALEDEQFDILPGQTYVKGFLRSYAEYLGLDGQLYVDEYNSRYILVDEETPLRARSTSSLGRTGPRFESSVVLVALAAIAILTLLVFAAWRFGSNTPETAIPDFSAQPPAAQPNAGTKARPAAVRRDGCGREKRRLRHRACLPALLRAHGTARQSTHDGQRAGARASPARAYLRHRKASNGCARLDLEPPSSSRAASSSGADVWTRTGRTSLASCRPGGSSRSGSA